MGSTLFLLDHNHEIRKRNDFANIKQITERQGGHNDYTTLCNNRRNWQHNKLQI